MFDPRAQEGQATVELVALLPLIAVVTALLWQAALAGQAIWLAGSAARAAARASAIGTSAQAAAGGLLPARLRRGLRTAERAPGEVVIAIAVPLVTGGRLLTVHARAKFASQR